MNELQTQIDYTLFIMNNYDLLTMLCKLEGKKPTAHNIIEQGVYLLIKQN